MTPTSLIPHPKLARDSDDNKAVLPLFANLPVFTHSAQCKVYL